MVKSYVEFMVLFSFIGCYAMQDDQYKSALIDKLNTKEQLLKQRNELLSKQNTLLQDQLLAQKNQAESQELLALSTAVLACTRLAKGAEKHRLFSPKLVEEGEAEVPIYDSVNHKHWVAYYRAVEGNCALLFERWMRLKINPGILEYDKWMRLVNTTPVGRRQ